MCADDVVAEFPFAPEGSPARIEGKAALYEYLRGYRPYACVDRAGFWPAGRD